MRRKGRRINQPGIGRQLFHPLKKGSAKFPPPESFEVAIPKEGEKHFLFEQRLGRRSQTDLFRSRELEDLRRVRDIGEIEKLKEAIDSFTGLELLKGGIARAKSRAVQLRGNPSHLGAIS